MKFTRWTGRHRRSLLFLVLVLAAGGVLSALKLPVALFPQVQYPRIAVELEAGDQPAEKTVAQVTRPAERAVRSVPHVQGVRSTTSRGSAEISINFGWGTDMVRAKLQVGSALSEIKAKLPPDTRLNVRRMNPTVFPSIGYSLVSPARSKTALYDLAYYQLRKRLSTVPGISRVTVLGGAPEEIHVVVNPAQLARYDLPIGDVTQALSASNVVQAAGVLEDEYKLYLVLTDAQAHSLGALRQVVLRAGPGGGLVRLSDVATVERSAAPKRTRVSADGQPAVLLQVYQQPGASTVQIAGDIRAKLDSARQSVIPQDVTVKNWYDQSRLISASAASVRDAVLIGVVLAMLVLFAFLRSARITLIAAVVVPAVLAATGLLLYVLGMSFNLMTLGGMAAAVGLIIDDAIVMVEHIVRRTREGPAGDAPGRTVLGAARGFTRPLVGSSAATIVIFTPMAFLTGVTGAFFRALSLTMAAALVISFFMAWLVVPLLAEWLLADAPSEEDSSEDSSEKEGRWARRVYGGYEGFMQRLLGRPALVLVGLVPLVLLGYLGYRSVGSGFIPSFDEGGFILDYYSAPGTSLSETNRLLGQVGDILKETPEVQTYSLRVGVELGGGITESNTGDFFVRLKPPPRRSIEAVMSEVRAKIKRRVPGLDIELVQLMEDLIGDLTAVPEPIEVKLFAKSAGAGGARLDSLAPKVAGALRTIPGVVDVNDGVVVAGDALVVHVDRAQAALEGIDPQAVARKLKALVGGDVATTMLRGEKSVGVRVWTPKQKRGRLPDLEDLLLQAPDGHRVPVRRVARVERAVGQPQIAREDLRRIVAVTGRISGRDLGSTIRDVKAKLNGGGVLPGGVSYRLGGLYRQQQRAFSGLLVVFGAAVMLVFLLLLFLYERFRVAAALLVTTALSFAAVYLGLWLTGTRLNIASIMGLTMIVGIVTEGSIFYYSVYRDRSGPAGNTSALIAAGKTRLRPVTMTTLAAMLALAPLALGLGQGAGLLQPLAIAIEAGLLAHFPLLLLVLPVLLRLFGATSRG